MSVQFEPQRTLQGTPPSISRIEDQITSVGNAVGPIPVTVSDAETPVENLTVTPLSTSNPDLIPLTNVIVSGSGAGVGSDGGRTDCDPGNRRRWSCGGYQLSGDRGERH